MFRYAMAVLLAVPMTGAWAGMTTTITDTQPIIDYPLCRCGTPLPGVLDFALFDFSTQAQLCNLDRIELTFTMQDGDTGIGDFDYNNLTLALDDVNTGLKLNGFGSNQEPTLTLSLERGGPNWMSDATVQQILDRLNEDGQLFASIVDATPNDNDANLYSMFDTTLALSGTTGCQVPEPATILVWGVAGLALAYRMRVRRDRRS